MQQEEVACAFAASRCGAAGGKCARGRKKKNEDEKTKELSILTNSV